MIFGALLATLLPAPSESPLALNNRIEKYQESKALGTKLQVEKAKSWDKRVFLATYPRSGNHWMRYLIEEATGIATSSAYCDPDPQHLKEAFEWGGFCCQNGYEGTSRYPENGEIAIVKTHFPELLTSRFDRLPYVRAVRIVRHPVDSIYSLYLWVKDYKRETPETMIPDDRLREYIYSWKNFQQYWDLSENVLTIRFEDLYHDPAAYLKLVLTHIGYSFTDQDIARAVARHPPKGGLLKHFEHYTEEDLALVQKELGKLMQEYGYELKEILPL